MHFAGWASLELVRTQPDINRLCRQLMRAGFEPAKSHELTQRFIAENPAVAGLLNPRAMFDGGTLATEALVFFKSPAEQRFRLSITSPQGQVSTFVSADLELLSNLLRAIFASSSFAELNESLEGVSAELQPMFDVVGQCYVEAPPAWPSMPHNGIQRREHASLLIQHGDAIVISDPVQLEKQWMTGDGISPNTCNELASTILLSHTHNDHYALASMLAWEAEGTRVIAPNVRTPSMLARDVGLEIARAGMHCERPAWHTSITDADVVIDILPFFGEQPTTTLARPFTEARNWGNCYRINTPAYSMLLLFDSGVDPEGNMLDVVQRSVAEKGPIDLVMSCSLTFPEGANPGLPDYLLMVPFEHLRALAVGKRSMTLGPTGLADVCRIASAKWFMPFAHGFSATSSDEGRVQELADCDEIQRLLLQAGTKTKVRHWDFGDILECLDGEFHVRPAAQ